MSVYDTATKLASEIRNSKEYNDFVTNMKQEYIRKEFETMVMGNCESED